LPRGFTLPTLLLFVMSHLVSCEQALECPSMQQLL
jgi:hypothetical protein